MDFELPKAIKYRNQGLSYREIGSIFSCSHQYVCTAIKKRDNAVLNDDFLCRRIISLYDSGESIDYISSKVCCTAASITAFLCDFGIRRQSGDLNEKRRIELDICKSVIFGNGNLLDKYNVTIAQSELIMKNYGLYNANRMLIYDTSMDDQILSFWEHGLHGYEICDEIDADINFVYIRLALLPYTVRHLPDGPLIQSLHDKGLTNSQIYIETAILPNFIESFLHKRKTFEHADIRFNNIV